MEQSKNTYEIQEWAVLMEREGTFNQFFENDKDVRKKTHFENTTTMLDQIKQTALKFRVLPDFHEGLCFY